MKSTYKKPDLLVLGNFTNHSKTEVEIQGFIFGGGGFLPRNVERNSKEACLVFWKRI